MLAAHIVHSSLYTKFTHKSVTRPLLEYACVVQNPRKESDAEELEMIQKTAIWFIYRRYYENFSPSSNLSVLNLTTLSTRECIESPQILHSFIKSFYSSSPRAYIHFV